MILKYLLTIILILGLVNIIGILLTAQGGMVLSQDEGKKQESEAQQATQTEEMEELDSGYTYDPTGKRDPFKPIVPGIKTPGITEGRPRSCPAECLVSEMELKGIVKDINGVFIAIFVGPDKKTCKMKVGDKFYDGEITSIDLKKVMIKEEVQDPTEIIKFRSVIKYLHPTESKK